MRMKRSNGIIFFAILIMACFLISGDIMAQTISVTLEGIVSVDGGNPLPGASIVVKNVETGFIYGATSGTGGKYIVSGIEPGKYEVEVSIEGFVTQIRKGLTFSVGASLSINFSLPEAAIHEEVVVTAEAPMVEVTKSDVSVVVDREKIDSLPLLNRDYGSLVLLKAGVGGNRANASPRAGNEVLIDGVSNTRVAENRVKMRYPSDAVAEFRVYTNQYQAEYGNATGMVQSTLSRSGTNTFKGRVSFFYRDEAYDDANYFVTHDGYQGNKVPKDEWNKPPYEHYNWSGFLGGPIVKDKAHFFIAYEGLHRESYFTVTSPLVPKETYPSKVSNNNVIGKINYQVNEKNSLTLRFGFNMNNNYNLDAGGYRTIERATDYKRKSFDVQLNWTLFLSANTLNEFRVIFSREEAPIETKHPDAFTIIRPSGLFGHDFNMPQQSNENRYQIVDNFSLFLGDHRIKMGFDLSFVPYTGFINLYTPGEMTFLTDAPFDPTNPGTYPFMLLYNQAGTTILDWPYSAHAFFIQDTWKVSPRLTLNVGLRYNYYSCKGLDINNANIKNLNPRLAFSWDPVGDGKTVVRGGFGTFSQNPALTAGLVGGLGRQVDLKVILFPNYPDPFVPNPFFPSMSFPVSPGEFTSMEDQTAPYSVQWTLGFKREFLTDLSLGVDLVLSKSYALVRWENINPVIPGTLIQRPDPTRGDVKVVTDNGSSDYKGVFFSLQKRYSHGWALDITYTLSKSQSDVEIEDDLDMIHGYEPDNWERQYGPSDNDARHRLIITGIFDLPLGVQLSSILYYRSALPYTAFYLTDVNLDSLPFDYVDDHRNARRGYDSFTLDARLSKQIMIGSVALNLLAEVYNLTNRANFYRVVERFGLDNFGEPTRAGDPRLFQFGVRIDF